MVGDALYDHGRYPFFWRFFDSSLSDGPAITHSGPLLRRLPDQLKLPNWHRSGELGGLKSGGLQTVQSESRRPAGRLQLHRGVAAISPRSATAQNMAKRCRLRNFFGLGDPLHGVETRSPFALGRIASRNPLLCAGGRGIGTDADYAIIRCLYRGRIAQTRLQLSARRDPCPAAHAVSRQSCP